MSYIIKLVREIGGNSDCPNYLCKDNYVHIRLKNYGNKKEVISGFESKLTLLVTYLAGCITLNMSTFDETSDIWSACISKLLLTSDFRTVSNACNYMFEKYKGIKILPAYSKKKYKNHSLAFLGSVSNMIDSSDDSYLDTFLTELDISLLDYLFNENIYLIVDVKQKIHNEKYARKYSKKSSKEKINYVELW